RACRSDRRTLAEMERHIPRPRWAENQVNSIGYAERAALVFRQAPGNDSGPVTRPYWRPPGPFLLSPGSHAGYNGGAETMNEPHDPNIAAGTRSAAADPSHEAEPPTVDDGLGLAGTGAADRGAGAQDGIPESQGCALGYDPTPLRG